MKSYRKLIKEKFQNQKGVALFIVLASMATLSIFVGEITYTAQINQKLAYDRLDQVKALALAKSGIRLALLRIRAYTEIKKTISKMSGGAGADAVNAIIPKSVIEKIWSEPITIPFSGDISGLPVTIRDGLAKFRKDSGMEGRLYISINAQSDRFNINSTLPQFAAVAKASPSPASGGSRNANAGTNGDGTGGTTGTGPTADPSATPVQYSAEEAHNLLKDQITSTFQKRFETDERFRDNYRNYRIEDLVEDIFGWSDLSRESNREQVATIPFKKAPFYHISELHYLQSMDDDVFNLLESQFSAGVGSQINVNMIKEPVLRALVPQMTDEESKKFFDFRDSTGEEANKVSAENMASGGDNRFKTANDFFKYLKDKIAFFAGSDSKISDFQKALAQRGIEITTEESNFLVHIEATVQQTKRTIEAMVSILPETKATNGNASNGAGASAINQPNSGGAVANPNQPVNPNALGNQAADANQKSQIKITLMRFL